MLKSVWALFYIAALSALVLTTVIFNYSITKAVKK